MDCPDPYSELCRMEFTEFITVPRVDGVILHRGFHKSVEGTLCITSHHLILSSRQEGSEELFLLLRNIDCIERKPILQNSVLMGGNIHCKCKDLQMFTVEIPSPQDYLNAGHTIENLCALKAIHQQYPYFYRPPFAILEDGFTIFRPEIEFSKLLASEDWRISSVNDSFNVCPTYSATIIVPKHITDDQIKQSASYRDGGRFPILSYRHENGAILMRSAQPTSQSARRSRADEAILNTLLGRSGKGFIIDTWGKGVSNTETDQHYPQWKKVNRSIGNVVWPSCILESFSKLVEACNDVNSSPEKWLTKLEESGWMALVLNVLYAACVVAQCLDKECSPVLVHGASGLDSTLMISSIVQILLNPDCRTIRGLQALIDREWIQAGHPFSSRHSQCCYTPPHTRSRSAGATFVLFLDCLYQIHIQFPGSFEYETSFLITLYEHSYFSHYGTFLCDSEKERKIYEVRKLTVSLWSFLNRPEILKNFLNPLYDPNPSVIWPSVAPSSLELWRDLYLRWVIDQSFVKCITNKIQTLVMLEKETRGKVLKLRKIANDLSKELIGIIESTGK